MFPDTQLFIVFEFEECGCDLEAFKVSNGTRQFPIGLDMFN